MAAMICSGPWACEVTEPGRTRASGAGMPGELGDEPPMAPSIGAPLPVPDPCQAGGVGGNGDGGGSSSNALRGASGLRRVPHAKGGR
jgi:hypothetical protein